MPEYRSDPIHLVNDHRQANLVMTLLPFASILCVSLILWVVL